MLKKKQINKGASGRNKERKEKTNVGEKNMYTKHTYIIVITIWIG
jgi:hypothetical protein